MKSSFSYPFLLLIVTLLAGVLAAGLPFYTEAAPGEVFRQVKVADGLGDLGMLVDFDGFGGSCASLGDLDGDGIPELAVGSAGDDTGGRFRGAVYILFLNADGRVKSQTKIANETGGFGTLDDDDFFGDSCTWLGDLDGDGIPELAVGAAGDDTGGSGKGAVYVLFLNANGTVKSQTKIADSTGGLGTLLGSDLFGNSCTSLGDLDGDGIPELGVGAPSDYTGGRGRGALYVLFLNADGTVKSQTKIANETGGLGTLADDDFFGGACASLSDLDGDGIPELAVTASVDDTGGPNRGAVYILFLKADGTVKSQSKIANGAGGFGTLADFDKFGRSCTSLGDLDGDGIPELAVGANQDDTGGSNRGAVYILFLNADGRVKSQTKIANETGGFGTLDDDDFFGDSCTWLGDLDGDGIVELAVGAPRDDTRGSNRGAVYVLSLGDLPLKVTTGLDELNTPSSAGDGVSLREAIRDAKATGEFRTITFDPVVGSGGFPLTRGPLEIDGHSVAIRGGPGVTPTISGAGTQGIFLVDNGAATLEGLVLAEGSAARGGGIVVENDATVVLDAVTIRDCTASEVGGGIINAGTLTVRGSSFLRNSAGGAGGIFNIESDASLRVVNTTFFQNQATAEDGFGGAIADFLSQASDVRYATFVENEAPDGKGSAIFAQDSVVFVTNSVFSDEADNGTGGNGFIATAGVAFVPIGDFAPLGDYGGKTPTLPLLAGSSAIDAGSFLPLPNTDQLGKARLVGSLPDLGAVEFAPPPPPVVAPPVIVNNFAQIVKLKKKLRKFKKKQKNARRKGQAAKSKKFKKKIKKLKKQLWAL